MDPTNESPLLSSMNNVPATSFAKSQFKRSGTFGKILNSMKPLTHEEGRSRKLLSAIYTDNIDEVKRLIKAGVDVKKYYPLIEAARVRELQHMHIEDGREVREYTYPTIEITRILIAAGADVDAQNTAGFSPLYIAASYGNIDMVRELLAADANINVTSYNYTTPLHIALIEGHHNIMELLLKSGANPNIDDPLFTAVTWGNIDAVRLLLEHGADVNKPFSINKRRPDIYFDDVPPETGRAIMRLLREAGLGEEEEKVILHTSYDMKKIPSGGSRKNKKKNKKRKTRRV